MPVPLLLVLILATALMPGAAVPKPQDNAPNILRFNLVGPDMAAVARLIADPESTVVAHVRGPETSISTRPNAEAPLRRTLTNPTPTGGPLVFQVLASDPSGWLKVKLPIRPNGSTGWLRASSVDLTINRYRVDIDTSIHQLTVSYRGNSKLETEIAIGTGSTPTPIGSFYLTELLQPKDADGIYGPFAFGLSGYSETLRSFNGGDGVIGLHGTNDPKSLGNDVSHGCVRIHNDTITELAAFLPLGTPVSIRE